jgi:acyl carrier protein
VFRNPAVPTVSELRAFLKERLPDQMIPSRFVAVDKLPLLSTGKVDRRTLPEFDGTRPEIGTPYVPPRTLVEEEVATIWAQVLSLDRVGVHDSFFDLGGHSLAAMRLVSGVIQKFKLELPLQSLFKAPTVAEMAAVITGHQGRPLGEEEMEKILTEVEVLTDEEAQRRLLNES